MEKSDIVQRTLKITGDSIHMTNVESKRALSTGKGTAMICVLKVWYLILLTIIPHLSQSQVQVTDKISGKSSHFSIVDKVSAATILYDASDASLIKRSAEFLA